MHEAVDSGISERRSGVRIARGIALHSHVHGLAGRADAVEFRQNPLAAFPIEYKRGKPKAHRADEVQLCAQALCMEEMLGISIPEGALFYGEKRRRHNVQFDEELRALTAHVAKEARAMLQSGRTPPARVMPGCRQCSLESLCQPKHFESPPPVERWFVTRLENSLRGDP